MDLATIGKIQALNLHWFIYNTETGKIEVYLDNHMMQTFRACQSRFYEEFVRGLKAKTGASRHIWFLDFGICTHTVLEYYYQHRKDPDFNILWWAGTYSQEVWAEAEMDKWYNEQSQWHHKNYKYLGGGAGFSALMLQYAQVFNVENERFRVVGTELYFGKDKSVPLFIADDREYYLSGMIDQLVDDMNSIFPMDHKTSASFGNRNPIMTYEVHEGMTGYVYAARKMLGSCNKMLMNFLQVKPEPNAYDRVKRMPIYYTEYQLEEYRKRQVSTIDQIVDMLLLDREPYRNTMVCTNWMHRECTFRNLHRQNSEQAVLTVIKADYETNKVWDPENRDAVKLEGEE